MAKKLLAYKTIIAEIFHRHYRKGLDNFEFTRSEFEEIAATMGVELPKNLGDIPYQFRFRYPLPQQIVDSAPAAMEWIIELAGRGRYRFRLSRICNVKPNLDRLKIKIPDSTPEVISAYALSDEQALLAIVRYNRPIDIFLGLTAFSLQNHLRTTVKGIGQIEIDEIYIGINKKGSQFIIPVQAKGGRDRIGIVQTAQDVACCEQKFPSLICRPVAAQFLGDNSIAMFELARIGTEIKIVEEKHYLLVPAKEITISDLELYQRTED